MYYFKFGNNEEYIRFITINDLVPLLLTLVMPEKIRKIQKIKNADKIAAGEVIERPANVVKELIENSIDANSSEIRIIVKRAGKTSIQVIDKGQGIPPDEVEIAFERHTSSKIRSIEDLDQLSTLGFRGEALASIAAVSKVEITSKTRNNTKGKKLIIEGGIIKQSIDISCPVGTNVKISSLFFNIPARQKFLKKDNTELGHITDIIQRYALAHPEIHFIYRHNDLDIINSPASDDLKTTIFHIYGKETAKHVHEFSHNEENFSLYGLIGSSKLSMKRRSKSSLFINNRYVISDLVFKAVQEAYKGVLMVGKFPFFIIYMNLDPSSVDFNIHPKKLQVRFENDDYVYNKVYNIMRDVVENQFMTREESYSEMDLNEFVDVVSDYNQQDESNEIELNDTGREELIEENVQTRFLGDLDVISDKSSIVPKIAFGEKYISSPNFPKVKLITPTGQLSNNVYILLEGISEDGEPGLYILDQHAASERITKEYFLDLYHGSRKSVQRLISPLKIELSPSEKYFLLANISEIRKLGFEFDHFGGNTFILRGIPTIIEKVPKLEIFNEIVSDLTEIGRDQSFQVVEEQIINYLACHKSIRGGDDLNFEDIKILIKKLSMCKDPFHCAHGRPTLKFFSFKELDKIFKRTG